MASAAAISAIMREFGKRGGAARAAKMSPERRQAIAKKAAKARWAHKPLTAAAKKAVENL